MLLVMTVPRTAMAIFIKKTEQGCTPHGSRLADIYKGLF